MPVFWLKKIEGSGDLECLYLMLKYMLDEQFIGDNIKNMGK